MQTPKWPICKLCRQDYRNTHLTKKDHMEQKHGIKMSMSGSGYVYYFTKAEYTEMTA